MTANGDEPFDYIGPIANAGHADAFDAISGSDFWYLRSVAAESDGEVEIVADGSWWETITGFQLIPAPASVVLSVAWSGVRFKRVNRAKPQPFITRHRIAMASRLLAATVLPVGAVARQCGYSSIYYFSRQFKHRTGQTPSDFRRGMRGE